MNIFKKQVAEYVPISVDFTNELATGETISSMTAVATDAAGTVVTTTIIHNTTVTSPICYATVKAGTVGNRYTITIKAITSLINVYEEDVFMDVYADINLLEDAKDVLRISSTSMDAEISDLIAAAKADLQMCGLLGEKVVDTNASIKMAIMLYCKANFGYDNPDAARFQASYESLRNQMSLCKDFAYYTITFLVKNSAGTVIDEAQIIFDGVLKQTNTSGLAVFYMRAGDNYEYQITHDDYQNYLDSDGHWPNVDVSASATINITMTA